MCLTPLQAGSNNLESWAWKDIVDLDVEAIAETHSFLFLWCGAEEGLEAGRVAMQVCSGSDVCAPNMYASSDVSHVQRTYNVYNCVTPS